MFVAVPVAAPTHSQYCRAALGCSNLSEILRQEFPGVAFAGPRRVRCRVAIMRFTQDMGRV